MSSTDPAGSRDFYRGLLGWSYQIDLPGGRGQEMTAWCGGRPVAGLATVPTRADQAIWTVYLATTNVVRSAQTLRAWGGRVLKSPAEVPARGTTVIGVDPVGAVIGFCQPARPWRLRRIEPGWLYWTPGMPREPMRFMPRCSATSNTKIGDGVDIDYTTWSQDGHPMLGRLRMHPDWADSDWNTQWMLHFTVDPQIGTDAAADRVPALGGRVDIDPYDSEFGRTALVSDPCGAAFA